MVASARVVNNTGIGSTSALSSVPVQSSASVYLAIGESIPTPAPENHRGSACEYFDVRRTTRRDQRRAYRCEHLLRHKRYPWQRLRASRDKLAERRPVFLQCRLKYSGEREEPGSASIYRGGALGATHQEE